MKFGFGIPRTLAASGLIATISISVVVEAHEIDRIGCDSWLAASQAVPPLFSDPALRDRARGGVQGSALAFAQDWARPSRAAVRAILEDGGRVRKLVVATHLSSEKQDAAVTALDADPRLGGVFRVLLVSPSFPATSVAFVDGADAIYLSDGGEVEWTAIALKIFVLGGWEHQCLGTTVSQLAHRAVLGGARDFTVHVLADHTDSVCQSSFRVLRDDDTRSASALKFQIWNYWPALHIDEDSFRRASGRLEFKAKLRSLMAESDVDHQISVILE